jgi:hypothetical protein
MPIYIDEVVIQVEVGNAAGGGAATPPAPADDRQALVAECVERVLEILREQKEP